jgi:hypothetical protein
MALPKKGLRKITVGTAPFAWSVTGNDYCISLTIALSNTSGQLLSTAFSYHSVKVGESRSEHSGTVQHLKQQIKITPGVVRQVIDYALAHGWQPFEKTGQFHLPNIENHIDLRLNEAS